MDSEVYHRMDYENFFAADEKPLDNLICNGGFCGIFRTIGCIGDSLSSGEHEGTAADGGKTYHDYYEYSWGQYMARNIGAKVYNFSRGGMTAEEYCERFAEDEAFGTKKRRAKHILLHWESMT